MDKLRSLGFLRVVAVVILIISSVLANIFSDSVNDAITSTVSERQNQNDYEMVGLSNEEKWPVLRISFPGKSFPNSLLGDIFDGELSAHGATGSPPSS